MRTRTVPPSSGGYARDGWRSSESRAARWRAAMLASAGRVSTTCWPREHYRLRGCVHIGHVQLSAHFKRTVLDSTFSCPSSPWSHTVVFYLDLYWRAPATDTSCTLGPPAAGTDVRRHHVFCKYPAAFTGAMFRGAGRRRRPVQELRELVADTRVFVYAAFR